MQQKKEHNTYYEVIDDNSPFDETLHSFVLRNLLLDNPNAKPVGVISKTGGWSQRPFVHKNSEHLFLKYKDHDLLEVIDVNKIITGFGNQLLDPPEEYALQIESTFFPNKESTGSKITQSNIFFCIDCIHESIRDLGFGYFKSHWRLSNYCIVHKSALQELPRQGFRKTFKSLTKILQGRVPKGAVTKVSFPLKERPEEIEFQDRFVFPVKLMHCLKISLATWILKSLSLFNDLLFKKMNREDIINECLEISKGNKVGHHVINKFSSIFLLILHFNPELLTSFLEKNSSLALIQLGPRKQKILKEVASVHIDKKCNSCKEKKCYFQQKRSYDFLDPQTIKKDFIVKNSYTVQRLIMQNLVYNKSADLNFISDSLWSPIKVDYPKVT
jgi:hypothetical protein